MSERSASFVYDVGLDNGRSIEEIVEVARSAEESAFDTLWIAEQHFQRGAISIAAAVAEATTTLSIGFGVLSPLIRHPAVVAMELMALSERWGNRFKLGYGVAHHGTSHLGLLPTNQVEGLREAAIATRRLLAGETAYEGARLSDRVADVPLYVGSMGDQTLAMSGHFYDGALLGVMCSKDFIASRARIVDEALMSAGRSRNEFQLGVLVLTSVSPDEEEALQVARRSIAYYLMEIPDVSPRLVGTGAGREAIRRLRTDLAEAATEGGIEGAARLIPRDLANHMAVIGTPEQVARKLAEYRDWGVDRVIPHHALGLEPAKSVALLGAAMTGAVEPAWHG